VEVAAAIACYIQSMSRYIMVEQRTPPEEDDYLVYTFNRFQACRFGLEGIFIDPRSHERRTIREDITAMLNRIGDHASELGAVEALEQIRKILSAGNGASWFRRTYAREHNLGDVMQLQAELWMGN
jgi:carboxylate-amine ligase